MTSEKRHHSDHHTKRPKKASKTSKSSKTKAQPLSTKDLTNLEHAMTQFQHSTRVLIDSAPDMDSLNEHVKHLKHELEVKDGSDPELAPELLLLSRSQLIQLAAQLKTLYNDGKLKVLDQIARFDENTTLKHVKPIRLSLQRHSNIDEKTSPTKQFNFVKVVGPHGEELPPLPQIDDPALEARVFTHKSLVNDLIYLSKDARMDSQSERLEFLGDSVLNLAATQILWRRFPHIDEGKLSKRRISLVNNLYLAKKSVLYGFDKRLRKGNIEEETGQEKFVADIFEAYIGALYVSGNYENQTQITNWLAQVMEPEIKKMEEADDNGGSTKDPKGQLYALVGTASLHPEYICVKTGNGYGDLYKVECRMNDEVLGTGEGTSAKEAGMHAAAEALKNEEAVQRYYSLRALIPRDQSKVTKEEKDDDTMNIELPVAVPETEADQAAKAELYAYLGKRKSIPSYKKEQVGELFKITLVINSVPMCYSLDKNSKKAAGNCATYIWNNKQLLKRCYVDS